MTPVLGTPTWTVWTTEAIYRSSGVPATTAAVWCWTAHGHRGSDSGVEARAQDAIEKAQCAMHVLTEPVAGGRS